VSNLVAQWVNGIRLEEEKAKKERCGIGWWVVGKREG